MTAPTSEPTAAPAITAGNSVVVVPGQDTACIAVTLGEVMATSDVPAGVVNLLTGDAAELAPHLAAHRDVNGLDLTGAAPQLRRELARAAAETVKRIYVPARTPDFNRPPTTEPLKAFLEIKTVWHPVGAVSLAGGSAY